MVREGISVKDSRNKTSESEKSRMGLENIILVWLECERRSSGRQGSKGRLGFLDLE